MGVAPVGVQASALSVTQRHRRMEGDVQLMNTLFMF
jgi:hypothetical protein